MRCFHAILTAISPFSFWVASMNENIASAVDVAIQVPLERQI